MRSLLKVIDQVEKYLNTNSAFISHSFTDEIESLKSSARYTAPEGMWRCWGRFQEIMERYYPVGSKHAPALVEIVNGTYAT